MLDETLPQKFRHARLLIKSERGSGYIPHLMTGSGILPHHAGHIEISLQTLRISQGMKELHHT